MKPNIFIASNQEGIVESRDAFFQYEWLDFMALSSMYVPADVGISVEFIN